MRKTRRVLKHLLLGIGFLAFAIGMPYGRLRFIGGGLTIFDYYTFFICAPIGALFIISAFMSDVPGL